MLPVYAQMAYYLHLSLILTFATTHPDSQFMILFIIPIKAWVIALIYLLLTLISVFNLSYPAFYFPHNLFPLVALANYAIFVGKDMRNLIPRNWRIGKKSHPGGRKAKVVPFPGSQNQQNKAPYNHRCTICGKTDLDSPELEFRYCSRCKGYHCYCEDHINNHTHVE